MLSNIYINEGKDEELVLRKEKFDEGYIKHTSYESIELIFTSFNEQCNIFNYVERNNSK